MNFEKIVEELINNRWSKNNNFFSDAFCDQLVSEFNLFKLEAAKVGSGNNRTLNNEIRSDYIWWLKDESLTKTQNEYLTTADQLKNYINQSLYLGLKEFECHLAHYPIDSHYSKHTDQFRGNNSRTVSLITYLNTPTEGGELIIYKHQNKNEVDQIIKPEKGMMVCFLSDELYHEVLPAKSDRYSITGWFKNKI